MKILLCNKFYYRRGGDCVYSLNLEELLLSHGHDVAVFAMDHPDTLGTPWRKYFPSEVNLDSATSKARFFVRSLGGGETASRFKALLDAFRPDVVHLNNIHSQLSPIIAELAHKRGCRVVWTLHDYKLLCPRYDCLKNGETLCEACFQDKRNVLRNSCMKNSLPASLMAYCEALKWNRSRLEACTDAFICPSLFMKAKMVQGGFNAGKLHHLCNFIDTDQCRQSDYSKRDDYYCYVGRLSFEKGVDTLIQVAATLPYRLVVVGDGPLMASLRKAGNIEYVGRKDWPDVKRIVGRARFLVIPSECYENNPLSVLESLSLGTPVLGASIGGIPELISAENGMCFESRSQESLASHIKAMYEANFDYTAIADAAMAHFSSKAYLKQLLAVYQSA